MKFKCFELVVEPAVGNPECRKEVTNCLWSEYPDFKEEIEYFNYNRNEGDFFFMDGEQYQDNIKNLWLQVEGLIK